jgi:hypothetical protein
MIILCFCVFVLFLNNGDIELMYNLEYFILYVSHFYLIFCYCLFQVPDMSSPGNPMSWIMSVEPLTGANYP